MTDPQRYTKHFDTVLALISHLALTTKERRTVRSAFWLTDEVFGLGANANASLLKETHDTLNEFPGLFRKVTTKENEIRYTLHLRWAQAPGSDPNALPPLSADLLKALLEFVSQRVEAEATEHQFTKNLSVSQDQYKTSLSVSQDQFKTNLKATARNSTIAVVAAVVAAILAAIATIIAARIK